MTEKTKRRIKYLFAGGAAGLANGLLGAGGGMLLVPGFDLAGLDDRKSLSTSVTVMLFLCAVSAVVYYFKNNLDLSAAMPYCAGGLAGGILAGMLMRRVPPLVLHRILGAFIMYAGIRMLLF